MEPSQRTVRRDASDATSFQVNILITLLALALIGLLLAGGLYTLRRRRRAEKATLLPSHHAFGNHKQLSISTSAILGKHESVFVIEEQRDLIANSSSPPSSPLPEIHITFPDEEDKSGKRQCGRVVVVRIGDSGSVGMEPVVDDGLPPYTANGADRFHSLELSRIGGLKDREGGQHYR
jgi:hypothetical protein